MEKTPGLPVSTLRRFRFVIINVSQEIVFLPVQQGEVKAPRAGFPVLTDWVVNDRGDVLGVKFTEATVDDRVPVPELTDKLKGQLSGDKRYISQASGNKLPGRGATHYLDS